MTSRPLRFGLSVVGPLSQLKEEARRAEQIGFGVVLLPDHLGMSAPLPSLIPIAEAAPELRKAVAYLPGPVDEAADRIRSLHELLGISYFTFSLTPTVRWETLEKLLAALR